MANILKHDSQPVQVADDLSPIRQPEAYQDNTYLSQDDRRANQEIGSSSFHTALNPASGPVSTANANRGDPGAFSQGRKSANYQRFLSINSSNTKTPDMKQKATSQAFQS